MRRRAALHLLCLVLIGAPARADWVMGRVVAITDGDTLTVLTAQRQQHRVRLSGIDAPERRQAFGQVSKQSGIRQDGLGSFPQEGPVQAYPRQGARKRDGCGPKSDPIRPGMALQALRAGAIH